MSRSFDELELPLVYENVSKAVPLKEPKLSKNAQTVLHARYLRKDLEGSVQETYGELFQRVARTVAFAETRYGGTDKMQEYETKFYNLMADMKFLPNSPTLMNAGTEEGQLSACFVIPVGDSMKEIFESVKYAALIQKSGGGVGYSFSRLRPAGDRVKTTKGVSSGPLSFMRVFNEATETVKQGGRRRGANMGVLRVDHPDILEFIDSKKKEGEFFNFNISVGITDRFMEALENNEEYDLINPRGGKTTGKLKAKKVWDKIIHNAWDKGDPGVLFIDRINRDNPTPRFGLIESTNPCGEACLLPFEACNLGSVNLSKFVKNSSIDFEGLKKTVRLAVRFLDDVIDVNEYVPFIPQIKKMTRGNRKIGLGIMGFADMLIDLGISYGSDKSIRVADSVMSFIQNEAKAASAKLAKERGPFPNWEASSYFPKTPIRNACVTSIAPTGTLSIIADCSPGIEPLFGVCFERNVLDGEKLLEINPRFEKTAKKQGFFSEDLMKRMSGAGTIQQFTEVPPDVRNLFVTAHDIPPESHVLMQAAFQKNIDMSVSKTINLPNDASMEEVGDVYRLAYKAGCKGITVFRDGCRTMQVITMGKSESVETREMEELDKSFDTNELVIGDALDQLNIIEFVTTGKGKNGGNRKKNGKNGSTDGEDEIFKIPTFFSNSIPCPECGEGTLVLGACSVCQHCGYSKCG